MNFNKLFDNKFFKITYLSKDIFFHNDFFYEIQKDKFMLKLPLKGLKIVLLPYELSK